MFLNYRSVTNGLFEELSRHDKRGGPQGCPNCGAGKESVEHVPFECALYDSQRLEFWECLKTALPPDAFEAFLCGSILDKTAFCLEGKQSMLVNDECSSWYNRVGNF